MFELLGATGQPAIIDGDPDVENPVDEWSREVASRARRAADIAGDLAEEAGDAYESEPDPEDFVEGDGVDGPPASASAVAADDAVRPPLRKRPRFSNPTYDVPGFGWLVHDVVRESLDAHCGRQDHECSKNPCRFNRSLKGNPRNSAQGKPLGVLLAWLFSNRPSHATHSRMKRKEDRTLADLESLSRAKRAAARQWARDNGLALLEKLEFPKGETPKVEPEGIP